MFFFLFWTFFASFFQKFHVTFLCHVINFPAVYSKGLEASGFSHQIVVMHNATQRHFGFYQSFDLTLEIHFCYLNIVVFCMYCALYLIVLKINHYNVINLLIDTTARPFPSGHTLYEKTNKKVDLSVK